MRGSKSAMQRVTASSIPGSQSMSTFLAIVGDCKIHPRYQQGSTTIDSGLVWPTSPLFIRSEP
jgi:hypothetical protein